MRLSLLPDLMARTFFLTHAAPATVAFPVLQHSSTCMPFPWQEVHSHARCISGLFASSRSWLNCNLFYAPTHHILNHNPFPASLTPLSLLYLLTNQHHLTLHIFYLGFCLLCLLPHRTEIFIFLTLCPQDIEHCLAHIWSSVNRWWIYECLISRRMGDPWLLDFQKQMTRH